MRINESDIGSIDVVEYATSTGIASVVDTARGFDIDNGAIDVVVATEEVVGLIGGMIGVVEVISGMFSHIGVIGVVLSAADIIKGDLFMFLVG